MKQPAFYFDASRCIGCKACMIACKDKNDLPVGLNWRRVVEYTGGDWVLEGDSAYRHDIFSYYVSIACNHCEKPICVESCPTTATHKDANGIVWVDQDKCIGCRYCEWSCPYHAPQYSSESGRMTKCDMCRDLLAEGKMPACVSACPSRALGFGEMEELKKNPGMTLEVAPLPSISMTKPALVIKPHRYSKSEGSTAGIVANREEM